MLINIHICHCLLYRHLWECKFMLLVRRLASITPLVRDWLVGLVTQFSTFHANQASVFGVFLGTSCDDALERLQKDRTLIVKKGQFFISIKERSTMADLGGFYFGTGSHISKISLFSGLSKFLVGR